MNEDQDTKETHRPLLDRTEDELGDVTCQSDELPPPDDPGITDSPSGPPGLPLSTNSSAVHSTQHDPVPTLHRSSSSLPRNLNHLETEESSHRGVFSNGHSLTDVVKLLTPDSPPGVTNGAVPISLSRHRITMEEVAPSASSLIDEGKDDWKMSLHLFTSKKRGKKQEDKKLPRSIRRYYKDQDEMITAFEEFQLEVDDVMEIAEDNTRHMRVVSILSKLSFFINLCLLIIKSVAGGMTGSLSVISAVIDSAVDLVSGALMWWSSRAMKHRDIYQYPQGRTKLEPIAIVVLSVVMASASVQMIREAVEEVIDFALFDRQGDLNLNGTNVLCLEVDDIRKLVMRGDGPIFSTAAILICCVTIVVKLVLFLVCFRIKNPSIQALAQDHRNDVLSNTIALTCGLIGAYLWKYADPLGAVGISVYIIISWFITGWQQIKMLTGVTARPDFLKKITWISLNHHPKVMLIDTVRAFHFGNNFLVEVDIVLPEEMNLKESHDIGESLQIKLEKLPEVERAFVHLDYEWEHHPWSEHKQV